MNRLELHNQATRFMFQEPEKASDWFAEAGDGFNEEGVFAQGGFSRGEYAEYVMQHKINDFIEARKVRDLAGKVC